MHAENLQECCFYRGKSPCGMQRARQGLVKFNPIRINFGIMGIGWKSYYFVNKLGFWGLGGPLGLMKFQLFFQGGYSTALFLRERSPGRDSNPARNRTVCGARAGSTMYSV